jgi:hypothetical protein
MTKTYIPATPAGTLLMHLRARSEDQAWENLLEDAKFMPYNSREEFEARGYEVLSTDGIQDE